jgi:hypothetical protein
MDTEASFRELSNNPNASPAEFDAFYLDAVAALGGNPGQLDANIKLLKALCLTRGIDHSRYKYRGQLVPPKKQSGQLPGAPQSTQSSALVPTRASLDVQEFVRTCREKAPFLSFCLLRVNNGDSRTPEKFEVLYSDSINADWIHKIFHPDSADPIASFQIKALDSSCSWVMLCLFHSSDRGVVAKLQKLLNGTPELLILDLADLEGGEEHYWKKDRKKLFNGTVPDKPSLLVHDVLDAEQECLIKDFFGSNAGFLVCSDLKGGFSGARVILVAPNIGPGDPRKYIVKVCAKSKSKLRQEFEHFQNLVAPFWIPNQFMAAEFKESPHYQAIRYPFASKDTIHYSTSFTDRYRKSASVEALQTIVGNIFDHSLCKKWREQSRTRKRTVHEAFEPILNVSASAKVLDDLLSPMFSTDMILDRKQLEKVLNAEVDFLDCPNHGDLHSDNIQVQDESHDVFLIDFGLTSNYPAGLDYAALEASIRFKLLDYSVDPKILLPLDADPLSKFDNLITPGDLAKGEADKAQKLCSMIRERFLHDFSDKNKSLTDLKIQYLCCLLVLCLRQIKYPEMNRRYILQVLSQILAPLHDHLAGGT